MGERFQGAVLVPTADEAVKDLPQQTSSRAVLHRGLSRGRRCRALYRQTTHLRAGGRARHSDPEDPRARERGRLDAFDEEVLYPCLVKPRESHRYVWQFETKLAVVHSLAEMRSAYLASDDAGVDVVIQELIPGPDITA